jgi:hypothetical protein
MLNCPLPLSGNNQCLRRITARSVAKPRDWRAVKSRPRNTHIVTYGRFTKQTQFSPNFKQRLGEPAEALRHGQERGRRAGIELRVVRHERAFLDHFREFPASLLRLALTRPKSGIEPALR